MKDKSIYVVYSHEYKTACVGNSRTLKQRCSSHCSDNKSSVHRYCDVLGIRPRDTFDIYDIMKCNDTNASFYEGHVYDLIERHLPDITLINKINLIVVLKMREQIGVTTTLNRRDSDVKNGVTIIVNPKTHGINNGEQTTPTIKNSGLRNILTISKSTT